MGPFELYARFARKEDVGDVIGRKYRTHAAWRKGIFWFGEEEHALLFVTLAQEDLPFEYRYADRFASNVDFHWKSQNQNVRHGDVARKLRTHTTEGRDVHLFIRARSGKPFVYLGTCNFVNWSGDKPFTVWWRLTHPVPRQFHVEFGIPPPQGFEPGEIASPEIMPSEIAVAEEIESRIAAQDFTAPDTWGFVRTRVGTKVFRREVLENFDGECCVDGLNVRDLIEAAHIKSWSDAPSIRLDPANGIALCTLHHRAFDAGLMHFARGGQIKIAEPLRESSNGATQEHLLRFHESRIRPWKKFPTMLHI